jgi:hypothetical protein
VSQKKKMHKPESPKGIRRRDFLALSSAGVLATALTGPDLMAWSREPENDFVSVGYLPGSVPRERTAQQMGGVGDIISADKLDSGDPAFIKQGARIGLSTLGDPYQSKFFDNCESFSVGIDYRPSSDVIFPMFNYENKGVPNFGLTAGQSIPLDQNGEVQLVVSLKKKNAELKESQILFTSGQAPGKVRLRRGLYLLAIGESPRKMDWRRIRLEKTELDEEEKQEYRLLLPDFLSDEVEFIVMDINYSHYTYTRQSPGGMWILK